MAEEKLLTVRDVSLILGVSEKEVMDLAENGKIPAYKVGGVYLRFKKEQIEQFRRSLKGVVVREAAPARRHSFLEGFSDFFYYNDFYILSALIILLMLYIIFKG